MLLELKNITKVYDSPSGSGIRQVLDDISLTVDHGDSIAVTGPSGSGKSTLLNIIGTLDKPSSGSVFLDNQDIISLSQDEIAKIRNSKIGFIFQLHHLLPQCTILENVLIPTIPVIASSKQVKERAKILLERVGLENHIYHRPFQLSGGEQQRVVVVRALINKPDLILADEPTGSLDDDNSKKLIELLFQLNTEENTALITVTHSQDLAEQMKSKYKLEHGKLVPY